MASRNSTRLIEVGFILATGFFALAACGVQTVEHGDAVRTIAPATSTARARGTLAVVALEDTLCQLTLVRADGSAFRALSPTMAAIMHVSWSSDGRSLAYEACEGTGSECESNMQVYVVDVDGGQPRNLSRTAAEDRFPAWSPAGDRLAFVSDRTGNQDLYLVTRDGTDTVQLTHTTELESSPEWSPDGQRIAFERSDYSSGGMSTSIWSIAANGTGPIRLALEGTDPSWSPDGSLIAFHCPADTYLAICTVHADGTQETRLTPPGADAFGYDWSPDGSLIAFASNRDPDIGIYIACPACAQPFSPRKLSLAPTNDQYPVWSSGGTMIAYSADGYLSIMSSKGAPLVRFPLRVLGPPSWQPGVEAEP